MMRANFTRTLATSTIKAFRLSVKDGKPSAEELPAIVVAGKVNEKEALKAVQKEYGKDSSVAVGSIEVEENLYAISVEDFMKHAVKVEKETK